MGTGETTTAEVSAGGVGPDSSLIERPPSSVVERWSKTGTTPSKFLSAPSGGASSSSASSSPSSSATSVDRLSNVGTTPTIITSSPWGSIR